MLLSERGEGPMTKDMLTMCHALDLAAMCALEAKGQLDGYHGDKSLNAACQEVGITSEPHQTGILVVTMVLNLNENTGSVVATHEPNRKE